MKELSLNILDISENSTAAGAKNIAIRIDETENELDITVTDDGCGMDEKLLKRAADPFCTTRTTRNVGLGIPLFTLAAQQTGGEVEISSNRTAENHGTCVHAKFYKNHIDFAPLGDVISTVITIIQGHPDISLLYLHNRPEGQIRLSADELRGVLGDIPLNAPEVLEWIRNCLAEQYSAKK